MASGHAVDFIVMRAEGELLNLAPAGAKLLDMNVSRLRSALLPLARHLRGRRPDALLAAMWPLTSIAIWARDLARVPTRVVVSDHTDYTATPALSSRASRLKIETAMQWSYPRADGIVAVSDGVARAVAGIAGMPRSRVSVIHNPVPIPSSGDKQLPCTAAPGWASHDGPRLIAVGSLKPAKDFAVLLSAFARMREASNARLLILGDGPLRGELEALKSRLALKDAVDMPGFVTNPYPYFATADVFVLSSAWEGFGNVIVEALACGTPVVATDCRSGPREILEDGRYGRLVPVGDPAALAGAICQSLAGTHDPAALMRRAGEFSLDAASRRYLDLLVPEPESAPCGT